MVDTHAHILAGVDDGPAELNEAVELIRRSAGEGVTDIIATPHAYHPYFHVTAADVRKGLGLLREALALKEVSVMLHSGQELRLHPKLLQQLKEAEALTLAGSRYVLIELPSYTVPGYTVRIFEELRDAGYVPVIAHAEKNRAIAEKPGRLTELIEQGALAQVTAGSLSGRFGKALQGIALSLVQADLIHLYGSDAHNLRNRPPDFTAGLDFLEQKNELDRLDLLLENNARILQDEPLIVPEPKKRFRKAWWRPD